MESLDEGMHVNGATRQTVKSLEDVMRIFYTGTFHRTTGETKMNRVSSRSHVADSRHKAES